MSFLAIEQVSLIDSLTIILYFHKMKEFLRNLRETLLTRNWGALKKVEYELKNSDSIWEKQTREVYDRGDGATILLYNTQKQTVILTRQFRIPTYLNGNPSGMMIEACAGKMDETDPKACIIREAAEETGYEIPDAVQLFSLYMSPGSVTELIHFFVAEVTDSQKKAKGGGVEDEQENIEVLEVPFKDALKLVKDGEIRDGKTVILLQYAEANQLLEKK